MLLISYVSNCNPFLGVNQLKLKVWGEYALFSRPEYKAEPYSYPVPTPSAIDGLLSSIFWKPEIRFELKSIMVLKPIRYFRLQRNMLQSVLAPSTVKGWAEGKPKNYTIEGDRTQRNHVVLRDVAYVLDFRIEVQPHAEDPASKYVDQFSRRVERGQCYRQPYLGVREFPAYFTWADGTEQPHPELLGTIPLGIMLEQIKFCQGSGNLQWKDSSTKQWVSGSAKAKFFNACLIEGIMNFRESDYAT